MSQISIWRTLAPVPPAATCLVEDWPTSQKLCDRRKMEMNCRHNMPHLLKEVAVGS